jgi:phospholipid transport system substrate-binding protein
MIERRRNSTNYRFAMGVALRLTGIQVITGLTLALGVALAGTSVQAAPVARVTTVQAPAANMAETFVQQNIDRGYEILNNMNISESERHTQFRDFLLGLIDSRRISLFTLGQYGNGASQADIDAFISAFTDYAETVYERRLTQYKDQILKVTGSVARAADDIVVNCEVTDPAHPTAPPYEIAFRVRKAADGRSIVTDMSIEGIWQALSQRADFSGFLQQHGGRIAELTHDLERAAGAIAHEDNGKRFRPDRNGFQPTIRR